MAAEHCSEVTIRQAFDAGGSTHSCHYNLRRSLAAAVGNSHETIVRLILEQIKDPSIFTQTQSCGLCEDQISSSETPQPLYLAAVHGNLTISRLLLAYNITFEHDHRYCDQNCLDPVLAAVKNGHLAVVQVLGEAGYAFNDKRSISCSKTLLHVAVRKSNTKLVEYLLDKGVKLCCDNEPLLISAARKGRLETVKLLLERGVDPNESYCGPTALGRAAGNGHVETVELLLDHGADPDPDEVRGWWSTLYCVAESGQVQILHLPLARGADLYPKEPKKQYDLLSSLVGNRTWRSVEKQRQATFAGYFRTFVDFEDTIDHGDDEAQAQLLYIAIGYGWDDIVQRVIEKSFSAEGIYHRWETKYKRPILQAICNGHFGIANLLIKHGANIQEYQGDDMDEGALPLAIQLGNVQFAELLIDHGAEVNCISNRGETALAEAAILASKNGKVSADMFRMLLDRGADPTKTALYADSTFNPSSGENAITRALYFGAVDVVQILAERGIALEMPPLPKQMWPENHREPVRNPKKLIEEAFLGGEKMAEFVLDRGLLILKAESVEAQEGLVHAVQFSMAGVVKRLLERGVDPELPLLYDPLVLLVAAIYPLPIDGRSNAAAILDLLLAHGADMEERCNPGITPLYWTIASVNALGKRDCDQTQILLLLERGADPFAKHDHWSARIIETRETSSSSLFLNRRSIPSPDTDTSNHHPKKVVKFRRRKSLTGQDGHHDDPFLACMRLGDKKVLKLMLDAIDRKETPLEKLKDRLDQARIEATENGNLHLLPILEDYYWPKIYPCK
ncbi:unnamed protein product [Penicillium glandicola]